MELLERFRSRYPFPLDDFQVEAIRAIEAGQSVIVLDECHYMGDEGRGTVWEEIIVSAPPDVVLVGLSATVANVKEIADWISIVHRPIVPIYHPHRPVPLTYVIADLAGEIHEIDR